MVDEIYRQMYREYRGVPLVFGDGNKNGRVLLLGEAPGADEVARQRPFVGKAGSNLKAFLSALDFCRDEIYVTNVCKFRPFRVSEKGTVSNRTPTKKEVTEALPWLMKEIAAIRPEVLVTLGNTPLRAVTGDFSATIGTFHGKETKIVLEDRAYSLFALYHPASIIYNPALGAVYARDIEGLAEFLREKIFSI
ncbi:MAG: uracil-DNA glycosylase [Christensenella sp.]|nr:uracil-DNA glycosylase [Christensenella sp.]